MFFLLLPTKKIITKGSITFSTFPNYCPQAGRASSPQSRVLGTQCWFSIQFTEDQPLGPRWSRLLMRRL
jgi:hypothetical protein